MFRPRSFTFLPYTYDDKGTIVMSSGLLHPPFLNASYSMSEKYGILGWLIGRQIISIVFGDYQSKEQTQYQPKCEPATSTPFETQLCCLSGQINSGIVQKEVRKI
ncbi:unnamed protein product [Schistosoma rodhaini]|nr:unnamed protein product [Schistosoma rodhaini]